MKEAKLNKRQKRKYFKGKWEQKIEIYKEKNIYIAKINVQKEISRIN